MSTCFLGLGSNMGNTNSHFDQAESFIEKNIGSIIRKSTRIITKAWGNTDQADFLNGVLEIKTTKSAFEIMSLIHQFEETHRNKKQGKWMPRTIDVDILYFDVDIIFSDVVNVPHPYIQERTFVLDSLVELAPDYIHPIYKLSNKTLLSHLKSTL